MMKRLHCYFAGHDWSVRLVKEFFDGRLRSRPDRPKRGYAVFEYICQRCAVVTAHVHTWAIPERWVERNGVLFPEYGVAV